MRVAEQTVLLPVRTIPRKRAVPPKRQKDRNNPQKRLEMGSDAVDTAK
jgi:hypothetical protein